MPTVRARDLAGLPGVSINGSPAVVPGVLQESPDPSNPGETIEWVVWYSGPPVPEGEPQPYLRTLIRADALVHLDVLPEPPRPAS